MLDASNRILIDKKIQLKPYVARAPLPYELMTDDEIAIGSGGTLIVDTESYLNYFLIAFKDVKTSKIIRLEAPFNAFKLSWIMHNYKTIGFNSIKYDLAMIWASYINQDTKRLQSISLSLISGTPRKEVCSDYHFNIHKTNHIDLIEVCPLKGSLKLYGARIHQPRLQDLPFDVSTPLAEEQKEIVADYCISADLNVTHGLYDFMKDRLDLRQAMSIEYNDDLMSKSDAQIAEAVISREVYKINKVWPKRPTIEPGTTYYYSVPNYLEYQTPVLKKVLENVKNTKFVVNDFGGIDINPKLPDVYINKASYTMGIGGLHSNEKNVSYKSSKTISIIDRDVASYYPRIILNQGLYPVGIGQSFTVVYNSIVDRRLLAKANKNFAADKGLKVTINGTFGKTGSQWSVMYSPDMFIQIVLTGQLTLLMLIEMIELAGIEVISANTDGIVMLCPQFHEQRLADVIRNWECITGFTTEETRYINYYARDVNNYIAVKTNNEVKCKGAFSEVGSTTGTQLDINPSHLICIDAIKKLLIENIPIEKTIFECKDIRRFICIRNVKGGAHKNNYYLGKVVRWAYFKSEIGTINYILSGNKVPETDGARPLMDLPSNFPDDLNYAWYVDKTKEILYDIAYYKRPEQIKFF